MDITFFHQGTQILPEVLLYNSGNFCRTEKMQVNNTHIVLRFSNPRKSRTSRTSLNTSATNGNASISRFIRQMFGSGKQNRTHHRRRRHLRPYTYKCVGGVGPVSSTLCNSRSVRRNPRSVSSALRNSRSVSPPPRVNPHRSTLSSSSPTPPEATHLLLSSKFRSKLDDLLSSEFKTPRKLQNSIYLQLLNSALSICSYYETNNLDSYTEYFQHYWKTPSIGHIQHWFPSNKFKCIEPACTKSQQEAYPKCYCDDHKYRGDNIELMTNDVQKDLDKYISHIKLAMYVCKRQLEELGEPFYQWGLKSQ